MALIQSLYATGALAVPTVEGSEVVVYRSEVAVPATLAADDILEMGALPADHKFADLVFDATDIDTNVAPAVVLEFGFLNDAKDDLATVLASTTVGQGGGIARVSTRDFIDVTALTSNRAIGYKVATAGATAAVGSVGVSVYLRSA